MRLLRKIKDNVVKYSMQTYSSNVVEAALGCSALCVGKRSGGGKRGRSWIHIGVLDVAAEIHSTIFSFEDEEVSRDGSGRLGSG